MTDYLHNWKDQIEQEHRELEQKKNALNNLYKEIAQATRESEVLFAKDNFPLAEQYVMDIQNLWRQELILKREIEHLRGNH